MIKCPVCEQKVDDKNNYCPNCAWEFEYFFDEPKKKERKKYEDKLRIHKGIYLKYIEKKTFTDKKLLITVELKETINNYISWLEQEKTTSISLWFVFISLVLNFIFSYDASFMNCPEFNNSEYAISILPRNNMFSLFIINIISLGSAFGIANILNTEFCVKEKNIFIPQNIYKKYNIYDFYNKKLIIEKTLIDTDDNIKYKFRLININKIINKKDEILKVLNKSDIFDIKVYVLTIIIFLLNIGIFVYWLKICTDTMSIISIFQVAIVSYIKHC